jgi:LmbE family N-acetylglucosaminyl deacetylase
MRIACIHAHPDDVEFLAAGTLALLAKAGHEITIVTMTAGDCGSGEYGPEELSEIRKKEAAAAADLIGARYVCAGFKDLAIFSDDPSRRRVTELLRMLKADVILTASPSDYLCDHEATSVLVRDACFTASVPNYATGGAEAPLARIPHLYFVDPIEVTDRTGARVDADVVIDIGSTFATKKLMLAKHESQRAWLQRQHNVDTYLEQMEAWSRAAARAGAEFGEGFRQYRVHPYPQSDVLSELLRSHLAAW